MTNDNTQLIQEQVQQARQQAYPLSIHGSGSHQFMLADYTESQRIDMTRHQGIIDYQPTELTIRARAGTAVQEIITLLAEQHQQLATDFPVFSPSTTLGGAIAIGHTGSGRPYLGAIRDHILGATMINGQAQISSFGGQVMKNVAGYDVSRLLTASRGTLGVILDLSLKVLPAPKLSLTLVFEMNENQYIETSNAMSGQSLPINASVFIENSMYVRLQGSEAGLKQAQQSIGGEVLSDASVFWQSIQQQTHDFFKSEQPCWRVIVPATTPKLQLESPHSSLLDWSGGLRWVKSAQMTQNDITHITNAGGYLESYRNTTPTQPAEIMNPLQRQMHQKIKHAFDPDNLLNPKLSGFV